LKRYFLSKGFHSFSVNIFQHKTGQFKT
jgi:hypothetical protein